MSDFRIVKTLSQLYKIIEAGEKGYATAAVNMPDPGIKFLFKSIAQQRLQFKTEIWTQLSALGQTSLPASSLPGVIHRGRVAIFAAMTIEEEYRHKVILNEVALGEKIALRQYKKTLEVELPPEIRQTVQRQLEEVQTVVDQIQLLRGQGGKRLVVRLFSSDREAEMAVRSMQAAGFSEDFVQKARLEETALYQGKGATVSETVYSGMFGGALWGGLTGILVGLGVIQTTNPATGGFLPVAGTWLLVALGFALIGVFISSILAFFIGIGISEDDTYQYKELVRRFPIIIQSVVDQERLNEAYQILTRPAALPGEGLISNSH